MHQASVNSPYFKSQLQMLFLKFLAKGCFECTWVCHLCYGNEARQTMPSFSMPLHYKTKKM